MRVSVKILGERNSGTNFLAETLRDNFDVHLFPHIGERTLWERFVVSRAVIPRKFREMYVEHIEDKKHRNWLPETGGWKHALVTERFIEEFFKPQGCQVICSVRHPVAWARSMQKNPFHVFGKVSPDFATFIQTPWKTRPRDNLDGAVLDSPLELWRLKVQSYLDFAEKYDNFHVIRYEDLLLEPEKTLTGFARYLPLKTQTPALPDRPIRVEFVDNEATREEYITKARETSFSALEPEILQVFRTYIGTDLPDRLGYS